MGTSPAFCTCDAVQYGRITQSPIPDDESSQAHGILVVYELPPPTYIRQMRAPYSTELTHGRVVHPPCGEDSHRPLISPRVIYPVLYSISSTRTVPDQRCSQSSTHQFKVRGIDKIGYFSTMSSVRKGTNLAVLLSMGEAPQSRYSYSRCLCTMKGKN